MFVGGDDMADLVGLHNGRRAFTPWGAYRHIDIQKEGRVIHQTPPAQFPLPFVTTPQPAHQALTN
jgi:hypothetical protein